jgi:hypothetical protein
MTARAVGAELQVVAACVATQDVEGGAHAEVALLCEFALRLLDDHPAVQGTA